MSVVLCEETSIQPRKGTFTLKYAARKYTRYFIVITDNDDDGPKTVRNASGLPAMNSAYVTSTEADPGAFVVDINPQERESRAGGGSVWDVEVIYDSKSPFDWDEVPWNRPPVYSLDFEEREKAVQEDLDGKPVVNSASMPYDPPQVIQTSMPVIGIMVNKQTFSISDVFNLQDGVNSATWNGFPAYTCLARVKVQELREGGSESEPIYIGWTLNWSIKIKWDGWIPTRLLDAGYYYFADVDNSGQTQRKLVQARDAFGVPVSAPILLDGNGGKLAPGASPVYREFRFHRIVDFSSIP